MSPNDRQNGLRPSSIPPDSAAQIDASWDDETVPGLDLDDPLNEFDRVTAIPDMPSHMYVKEQMSTAEDSRVPKPGTTPPKPLTLSPDDYFSLDSGPPPGARSADSTAPYQAMPAPQAAVHARPTVPARSPGMPFSPSPTGLELADLGFDSISDLKSAERVAAPAHDPRDPVLELEFDDSALVAPPLAATTAPPSNESSAIVAMKDRYAMGDFSGALVIAEGIIDSQPEDLEAPRYAQSCRDVLTQMYSARLGSLDQIVAVAVPSDQIRWLTLDHRAGFLLSLIDGGSTVDQILDISGMTRLDALRIMYQLLDQRVISLGA